MQMSSNQYYLVVQINVQNQDNDKKHVYENFPWETYNKFLIDTYE